MIKIKTIKKSTFSIVIPCLNETETIDQAIIQSQIAIKKYGTKRSEVIVCDNGSVDGSVNKIKKHSNAKLIHVPILGYGAALHYGILSSKNEWILFADADLSYDFRQVDKFLKKINRETDLILGSRFTGEIKNRAMPILHRYIGTPILTYIINVLYGVKTTDCNSGMRMIRKSYYRKLPMKNSGMEWASELLIKTAMYNGNYTEVPIVFKKDKRKKRPHLRSWEDGWRHLKVIVLLKPIILIYISIAIIAIGLAFINKSLFTTIAFMLMAEFIFFSFLISKKLEAVINKKENSTSSIIDRLPLVIFAIGLTIFGVSQLFLIQDNHLFTKYIIFFQMIIFDLWLFFSETIKTHLKNPLPDKI